MNLKQMLSPQLTQQELGKLVRSYDVVGDIAIIRIAQELEEKQALIAEAVLQLNKNIRVVARRNGPFQGEYRTQALEIIAGEQRKETVHKENGVRFILNPEEVYFSVRLSTERQRIASLVRADEEVLVLFSGIGAFPLIIGKNSPAAKIIGIEKNQKAHDYGIVSLALNRRIANVELISGDVSDILPTLTQNFDRLLMPLPHGAQDFLAAGLNKLRKGGVLYFYTFQKKANVNETIDMLSGICVENGRKCSQQQVNVCGHISTDLYRICIDARIE